MAASIISKIESFAGLMRNSEGPVVGPKVVWEQIWLKFFYDAIESSTQVECSSCDVSILFMLLFAIEKVCFESL